MDGRLERVLMALDDILDAMPYIQPEGWFVVRTNGGDGIHGRMAVRAFAYSIAAQEPEIARILLDRVGREG